MHPERPLDSDVVRQAIAWWVRLRGGSASPRLARQCAGWRAAHPAHEEAWLRIQALDAELGRGLGGARHTLESSQRAVNRRRAMQLLAGGVVLGGAAWTTRSLPGLGWGSDFATATGQRQRFTLPSGAALTLNTHSSAALTPAGVRLKHGELLLDTQQPLAVACSFGTVTLERGRIALRDAAGIAQLSVLRGTASVQGQALREGQSLRATALGLAPVRPELDPAAWADGLIVTQGMPLGRFLDELARYRVGVLGYSVAVAPLMLSGVYLVDDSDALLQSLPQVLPVRLSGLTRWWVRVEALG